MQFWMSWICVANVKTIPPTYHIPVAAMHSATAITEMRWRRCANHYAHSVGLTSTGTTDGAFRNMMSSKSLEKKLNMHKLTRMMQMQDPGVWSLRVQHTLQTSTFCSASNLTHLPCLSPPSIAGIPIKQANYTWPLPMRPPMWVLDSVRGVLGEVKVAACLATTRFTLISIISTSSLFRSTILTSMSSCRVCVGECAGVWGGVRG